MGTTERNAYTVIGHYQANFETEWLHVVAGTKSQAIDNAIEQLAVSQGFVVTAVFDSFLYPTEDSVLWAQVLFNTGGDPCNK